MATPQPSPERVKAAQTRVHDACLRMVTDRLVVASAGNISELVAPGWFVVSPSGHLYEDLKPADYPLVDLDTGRWQGEFAPTSEIALHIAIYTHLTDTTAIVHTHSRYAAAFAVALVDLPFVVNENVGPASEQILVTQYAAPGTENLGLNAVRTFKRQPGSRAILLANHGVVARAESVKKAYTIAAQVEWIAEVTHHASTLRPELESVVVIAREQQELIGKTYGVEIARETFARWQGVKAEK
jgi:L-fuculose-phosphate aldolase